MKFGIDTKVSLLSVGIILIFGFSLGFYFIQNETQALSRELDERAIVLLNSLSVNCEYPVLIGDQETISRLINGVMAQKDVVFCRIEDKQGDLLFQAGSKDIESLREFTAPIVTKKITEEGDEKFILGTQGELREEEIGRVYFYVLLQHVLCPSCLAF